MSTVEISLCNGLSTLLNNETMILVERTIRNALGDTGHSAFCGVQYPQGIKCGISNEVTVESRSRRTTEEGRGIQWLKYTPGM